MRRVGVRRRPSILGRRSRRIRRTTTGTTRGQRPWVRLHRTRSACTTCMATCGSGWRTARMTTTAERRRTGWRGRAAEIVVVVWCAAVRGTTFRSSSVRPSAAVTPPDLGATMPVFACRGRSIRLAPDSLSLYFLGAVARPAPRRPRGDGAINGSGKPGRTRGRTGLGGQGRRWGGGVPVRAVTVERFPGARGFLLGDRLRTTALDVLERLIERHHPRALTAAGRADAAPVALRSTPARAGRIWPRQTSASRSCTSTRGTTRTRRAPSTKPAGSVRCRAHPRSSVSGEKGRGERRALFADSMILRQSDLFDPRPVRQYRFGDMPESCGCAIGGRQIRAACSRLRPAP